MTESKMEKELILILSTREEEKTMNTKPFVDLPKQMEHWGYRRGMGDRDYDSSYFPHNHPNSYRLFPQYNPNTLKFQIEVIETEDYLPEDGETEELNPAVFLQIEGFHLQSLLNAIEAAILTVEQ